MDMSSLTINYDDCCNMNVTLASVIAQHLHAFRECNVASPVGMDSDVWKGMLEQMENAFKTYAAKDGALDNDEKATVKDGMRLFIEHFDDFWY